MKRLLPVVLLASACIVAAPVSASDKPPQTGFEKSGGAAWTTHEEELKFLADVDRMSDRVAIDVIGKTAQKRPLHLVQLGHPAPKTVGQAVKKPVVLFICTQHGNEPAGREACLQLLRDLAFTKDGALVQQLKDQTILFVPTANPDGRANNMRENSAGVDINRDHLNLTTPEARAMAGVVRSWKPEVIMDLHEYGPAIPAAYDDEVLMLWPRNLNTDQKVHDMADGLVHENLGPGAEENGYSWDEYGQYAIGPQDVHQAAGDGDEGIARNAMGLRHSLGILVETAVDADPRNGPQEVDNPSEVAKRRVAAHMVVSLEALEFMRDQGSAVAKTTNGAAGRKTVEGRTRGAPVYFGGADNQEPTPEQIQDPPPCAYQLTAKQAKSLAGVFKLLKIKSKKVGNKVIVSMAQPAEPLIPLLLDARGLRHSVEGKAVMKC